MKRGVIKFDSQYINIIICFTLLALCMGLMIYSSAIIDCLSLNIFSLEECVFNSHQIQIAGLEAFSIVNNNYNNTEYYIYHYDKKQVRYFTNDKNIIMYRNLLITYYEEGIENE